MNETFLLIALAAAIGFAAGFVVARRRYYVPPLPMSKYTAD